VSADRILLFGSRGQLGHAILRAGLTETIIPLSRADVDLENAAALRAVCRRYHPSVIINCAAYTAVDRAEDDRERCFAVNAHAPAIFAEEAERIGALLVHYSSDYVFDGSLSRPYVETDELRPLNVYGESKAAADRVIPQSCSRFVIIRGGWIFSAYGSNFVTTMLRLAREREEIRVVDDQIGSPTSARHIAEVTARVVDLHLRSPSTAPVGLFHANSGGEVTWYAFSRAILESREASSQRALKRIVPITTADFGARAPRPAYSVLDSRKLQQVVEMPVPEWRAELDAVLSEIRDEAVS
jgi:dTDP-4-dehydrorhamnose reductase